MTRVEFLQELRIALQGKISQSRVNEYLQYYENYIMEESRKGKSEEQVIIELGDPRLIAKTLITIHENNNCSSGQANRESKKMKNKTEWNQSEFQTNYSQDSIKLVDRCRKGLILLAILFAIICITKLVIFLLPVIILIVCIILILSMLLRNRK